MKEVASTRLSGMTVRGWLNLILVVVGVVVLGGAMVAAVLLKRTDDTSRELVDQIQPARVASYQVQAALTDQETAVRGYVIAADPQFLAPYYSGQDAEKRAAETIRRLVADKPDLLADMDDIERTAAAWRSQYAEPLIASVTPGAPSLVAKANAEAGKTQFDSLRALFDNQNQHLATARATAISELRTTQDWRDRILAAVIATFLITGFVIAILARNAVTRPLEALAKACRRITRGNFTEHIAPGGPKDIRSIAADVDDMRGKIVEELEVSRSAREQLAEQAAELRRSNAELEQFAYVASHDLQEPLRKVASFCQLLEKRYGDQLDERGTQYIDFAVDGAKRMQVLINDLLTFSRVGRLNTTLDTVELTSALDAAVANVATSIEETGAEITRSAELPTVLGDPTLLTMLWQNLLSNAVKFRRDDQAPRIVIDCQPGSGEHAGQWILTFSDNGIGIEDEFVDKVFVIFQRLHGRDAYAGTGIGLALVKKIVEYHGGTIWIDTTYDGGTRFRFTLPVMTAHQHVPHMEGTAS